MRVVLTERAEQSFDNIITKLAERWTEREVRIFFQEYETAKENIKTGLVGYPVYTKNIRYALIGKNNVKMFFEVFRKEKLIVIFYFFHNRDNPKKINL